MNKEPEQIVSDLAGVVRGDVYTDILHRAAYSTDASIYRIVPRCVVAPRDAGDVAAVVGYAPAEAIPVVARGAGSGLAGESLSGGIVFDMTRYMNKIIGAEDDGRTVTCEPGVVLDDLDKYLARFGRKIGPDPAGANRAENQAVINKAVPRTKRNRSGYNIAGVCHDGRIDMARLMAGSEGTLAIFTRVTLRTVPLPAAKGLLQLEFDSLDSMARAVPTIVQTHPT